MSTIPGPQVQGDGVAPAGGLGAGSPVLSRPRPTPQPRIELCPYCGRESVNTTRCSTCGGHFDALSKQATQNAMGPWWLRDGEKPIRPGCSYDTIRQMVAKGSITLEAVLRGPTTRQFWMRARRVPGVAHLLGVCHSCQREASPESFMCAACGASFNTETDRQHLGLSPVSLLPGQAGAERIAAVSVASVPIAIGSQGVSGDDVRGAVVPSIPASVSTVPAMYEPSGWEAGSTNLGRGFKEVGAGRRRGRVSIAGATGLMVLGAMVGGGAAWVALVRAQGGVDGALVAIGVREPAVEGGAGTVIASESTIAREPVRLASQRDSTGPDGTRAVESDAVESPAVNVVPVVPDAGSGGDATPGVATGTAQLQERLVGALNEADWSELTEVVAAMERAGALDTDSAARWRMAVAARVERETLAGLP